MKCNWKSPKKSNGNIIDQLLENRGIETDQRESFLNPDFQKGLRDSSLLPDFDKFQKRIKKAVEQKEKVGIFADYDADGIPGAAFLYKLLSLLEIECEHYIPSREEGYGLSTKGIDNLADLGCKLIITVDLGIRSVKEAEYCRDKGIDLIITDHHSPGQEIPCAYSVINPKIATSKYPFRELSGAGVVYKLAVGLAEIFPQITQSFLKWNLDLIAISTISDVVPLNDENRIIAKFGILVLRKTRSVGLRALYDAAGIDPLHINSYQVGYAIGPRINAPGRLGQADKSFVLLTTMDEKLANKIAKELNEENDLRQTLMKNLLEDADKIIEKEKLLKNNIILIKGSWAKGIIGPSASKIAEKYYRPVIVFTNEGGLVTGSARSIGEINMIELIEEFADKLEKFGGHRGAAGLSMRAENYNTFYEAIIKKAKEKIKKDDLVKKINPDLEINLNEITFKLANELSGLEPFGMGNSRPIFLTKVAKIKDPKFVGRDSDHLSSFVEHGNNRIKSIYFNFPYKQSEVKDSTEIDLLYSIEQDSWNGRNYLKLHVVDIDTCY